MKQNFLVKSWKREKTIQYPIYQLKGEELSIPIYQRNYVWSKQNIKYLFKDIIEKFHQGKEI